MPLIALVLRTGARRGRAPRSAVEVTRSTYPLSTTLRQVRPCKHLPVIQLEFWPESEGGPLWDEHGRNVALNSLPLPTDLITRTEGWASEFEESKLPVDSQGDSPTVGNQGDSEWLAKGASLFSELRAALSPQIHLFVTEPWWGDDLMHE